MKIFIENSFLFEKSTGMGKYTKTLMKALSLLNLKYELKSLNLPLSTRYKYIWQTLWLNTVFYIQILLQKPDILISPAYIMPYFIRKKTKYITVIHDICYYNDPDALKYTIGIFDLSTKIAIKNADVIVTVSETVKKELIEKFNLDSNRIKVIYNSLDEHFLINKNNIEILEKYKIIPNKYILSVATLHKRKNIPELIKAFEQISINYPDLKLVLVGKMGNEQKEKLTQHKNIIFTDYVPDEDIPTLYKNALLFVFPTLNEGFGIPLIEAQYCECPVLCSDIPVFREIAGNSAEFSSTKSTGMGEKIEYLINDPKRREELIKLGKKNVQRFSIGNITKQLKDIL